MAIRITIKGGICFMVATGSLSYRDFAKAWSETMQSPHFVPPMRALLDISAMDRSIPEEEIEAMVAFCEQTKAKFSRRCAIVCEPGSLVYGLVRMFCALAEFHGLDFLIFPDFDEACEWVARDSTAVAA